MELEPLVIHLRDSDWDLDACERLEQLIAPAFEHPNVVVDMSAVTRMDVACLDKIATMQKAREAHSGLQPARLVVTSPAVRRLFERVKSVHPWPIFGTLDQALQGAEDFPASTA
jgi:anti-anti-sigma regulatory factor